jgi:hypothetical protein
MRRTAICLPLLIQRAIHAATNTAVVWKNRVRLVRELIEEFKDAIGDKCRCRASFADDQVGEDGTPING